MKHRASTRGQRRLSTWLVALTLVGAAGCSGGANDGSTAGASADPKIQAIAESSKSSRELRKAVVDELKGRQPPAKPSSGRSPRKSP